jgi:cytochrome b/b6/petD-like protein
MDALKHFVNVLSLPQWSFTLSIVLFLLMLRSKKLWTKAGGLVALAVMTVFFLLSILDEDFRAVVTKPDNVPIVMMVFLVGFFVWLAMHKAHRNDALAERGEPTFERTEVEDKIFTWPDLVFSEFIAMLVLTVVMVVWSIGLKAPLEEPANSSVAPNPSKAPWYFLGLQEMLVYYDPWIAGVLLPGLIIVGLMAIPYIDRNPAGNGYFTFRERKVEIGLFLFGWLVLWSQMIVIGTFLRGPNWNFFGPYEYWDIAKVEPLVNVDLSEIIWIKLLGVGLPSHWLVREIFGILLVVFYLFGLPVLLLKLKWTRRYFGRFYEKMGPARYAIGMTLFLIMLALPIKMYLRWILNLKYFVHIQEYFFNI